MSKKAKSSPREYFILESEYGLDIKRYLRTFHTSLALAKAMKKYLDLKDPLDKHEIIHVREIKS